MLWLARLAGLFLLLGLLGLGVWGVQARWWLPLREAAPLAPPGQRAVPALSSTPGARSPVEPPRELVSAPVSLPAFDGVTAWLNTSEAITPESLRGKVTLIAFWAYSNARALRVLPVLTAWYRRYQPHGLEMIGVHTPEFPFERAVGHVQAAVERLGLPYPVAVDSDRRVWTAYRNHEWPAYYVADPQGRLIGFQIGMGREPEVEQYLRGMLVDAGAVLPPSPAAEARPDAVAPALSTPERTFRQPLGEWFVSPEPPVLDEPRAYTVPPTLPLHGVALDGVWQFEEDRVLVVGPTGRLVIQYLSPRCHLVIEGAPTSVFEVRLDGRPVPAALAGADLLVLEDRSVVRLDIPRLYDLVEAAEPAESHRLEVILPRGVSAYACTFG